MISLRQRKYVAEAYFFVRPPSFISISMPMIDMPLFRDVIQMGIIVLAFIFLSSYYNHIIKTLYHVPTMPNNEKNAVGVILPMALFKGNYSLRIIFNGFSTFEFVIHHPALHHNLFPLF